jgi:hypothetical protein
MQQEKPPFHVLEIRVRFLIFPCALSSSECRLLALVFSVGGVLKEQVGQTAHVFQMRASRARPADSLQRIGRDTSTCLTTLPGSGLIGDTRPQVTFRLRRFCRANLRMSDNPFTISNASALLALIFQIVVFD